MCSSDLCTFAISKLFPLSFIDFIQEEAELFAMDITAIAYTWMHGERIAF